MSQTLPHEQAMTHAKVAFMQDEKAMFLYTVCFHLKFKWSDAISTAQVDGYTMTISPDFWMKLPHEMRVTLLAHETGHVVRQHMGRRGDRDLEYYNYAGDYVINQELKDSGYTPITWTELDGSKNGWLQDDRFKGMTTEEVYDILIQEKPPTPPPMAGGGSGPPGEGDPDPKKVWLDLGQPGPEDGDGEAAPTPAEIEHHINEILVSAATACTVNGKPGAIPRDVQVYLDSLLKPKLPMAAHLRRFFLALAKNDYTWTRPNRRRLPIYLPSMRSEALTNIAFAFDMSGSVRDSDLKRYVSEMVGVMRNLKPDKITLVLFDTEIKSVNIIKSVKDMMSVKLCGRGGTDIEPLLQWAKDTKPTALVVFTDGEFYEPDVKPSCPVLWMIHNERREFKWPYGTIIPFKM